MTIENFDVVHLPTYIKEAAGRLHRYVSTGEAIAKAEVLKLLGEVRDLVHRMEGEPAEPVVVLDPAIAAAGLVSMPVAAGVLAPTAPDAAAVESSDKPEPVRVDDPTLSEPTPAA